MKLNEEQTAAVEHPLGEAACLIAGAGSGKTHVITERIRWMLSQGVPARKICTITFTNKAANELVERLGITEDTPVEETPRVSTIHSLSLSAIRRNPEGFGLQSKVTPLDDYDQYAMVKKIIDRLKIEDMKPKLVLKKMQFHRARGVGFVCEYSEEVHKKALAEHAGFHAMDETELRIWKNYEEEKTCQPPGTMVQVVVEPSRFPRKGERHFVPASLEWRAIETLNDGDLVVSWRKKDARTLYSGRRIKVASRNYRGNMYSVSSGGKTTRATHNHWFWVKFNDSIKGKYLVYLMHREDKGFRVGITKFKKKADSGLSSRMNGEGAEKAWILRVCETRFEAQTWEQVYSIKYGVPQTVFEGDERYLSLINTVFQSANPEGAHQCLRDHGLMWEYPFLQKGEEHRYSQTCARFFKTAACNLIANYMSLPKASRPTWNGGEQHTWRVPEGIPIETITVEKYNGRVFSLDVEEDHTYLADGLIVGNCNSVVDFDDMLHLVVRRINSDSKWAAALSHMCDHVLMDEAQDTNPVQWSFVNGLVAPENRSLYVVGDISQSIYGFTGAVPRILKDYSENWRGAAPKLYRIARNHRSCNRIVKLANAIQSKMTQTIPLRMESWRGLNGEDGVTQTLKGVTSLDVANALATEIATANNSGKLAFRDNCILVRSARQIRDVEGALVRLRIPYVVRGGSGLLQTEEVRDVLSYLRLATNPKDFMALARAVGVPKRGIGDVTLEKMRRLADEKYDGNLLAATATHDKLVMFSQLVAQVQAVKDIPVKALEVILSGTGYRKYIADKYKKDKEKVETKLDNLDRFSQLIASLMEESTLTVEDMVFQLTLDRPVDEKQGVVTISTIHSAKGLEWPRVYVTNVVEGSLPHMWSSGTPDEIEEERRLFYVACTRARDILVICIPGFEQRGNNTAELAPSRFLFEVGIVR